MVCFVFLVPLPSSWQQNACLLVSFDVQSDKTKNAEELLSLLAPQFEAFALPIITGTNNAEVHRSDRIFMSTPLPHQCRNVLHAVFRQQEQLRRNAVRRNAVPSHLGDIYRCLVLGNNSEFCEICKSIGLNETKSALTANKHTKYQYYTCFCFFSLAHLLFSCLAVVFIVSVSCLFLVSRLYFVPL